jgi:hypothetical protein
MRDYGLASKYIDRGLALSPTDYDAVHRKVFLNLLEFGGVDSDELTFEKIIEPVGIAVVNSHEMASSATSGFWRFIFDRINADEMIAELRSPAIRSPDENLSPYLIYMNLAQLFDLSGYEDSARIYYDSTKNFLLKALEVDDEDFHVYSSLGLTYAYLGQKDSAIWAGLRGKELIPVDECHW